MPSEKKLLEALDKDTVDTSRWTTGNAKDNKYFLEVAESKIYGLAVPQENGTLRAWHVTDDPEKVIELLKAKGDFYAREGDLCGGLYVSAMPRYWEGRSAKKWDFLRQLTLPGREKLYQKISEDLLKKRNSGYITESEFWNAFRHVENYQEHSPLVDIVVNQPYNVDVIRMVKDLDLAEPFQPNHIQVDFVGRYLEFNTQRAIEANEELLRLKHGSMEGLTRTDLCNMLKEYGWDGVYTKAGMGTNPELVIWNGDRVMAFGDWIQESGAELSGPAKTLHIKGNRFDASIAPNRLRAEINDKVGTIFRRERIREGNKAEDIDVPYLGSLTGLSLSDVGEVGVIADAGMQRAAWATVPTRRFRPRGHADRDGVDIVDPSNLKKIVHLDHAALQELMDLSVKLMGNMTMGGPRGLIP